MKRCLNCMEEYDEGYDRCPLCRYKEGEGQSGPFVLKEGSILQGRYIVGTCLRIHDCFVMYIGWDALFERRVSIQEFYPASCAARGEGMSLAVKGGMESLYHESLNRFVHYHRNLIRLYKEPDIICVYSCFKANGTAYATMQYSGTETLREWMINIRSPDEREAMAILYHAAEALKKVHGLGLVHGDVGPDSFWITGSGQLVLKDFAEPWHYCGDPDMRDYQNVGPWIDVYGLSMLFGRLISGQADAGVSDILKRLSREDLKIPVRAVLAVRSGLEEDSRRIQSLDEFADRIFSDAATMRLVHQSGKKLMKDAGDRRIGWRMLAVFIILAVLGTTGWTAHGYWMNGRNAAEGADMEGRFGRSRWGEILPDAAGLSLRLLGRDDEGSDKRETDVSTGTNIADTGITTEHGIVTEHGIIVSLEAAAKEKAEREEAAQEAREAEEKAEREAREAKECKAAQEKAEREAREAKERKAAQEKAEREAREAEERRAAQEKAAREAREAEENRAAQEKAAKEAQAAREAEAAQEKAAGNNGSSGENKAAQSKTDQAPAMSGENKSMEGAGAAGDTETVIGVSNGSIQTVDKGGLWESPQDDAKPDAR